MISKTTGISPITTQSDVQLPKLVNIPAGEFWMGCMTGRADERPVRRVSVDTFAMGVTTVTNEQYATFVLETCGNMPVPFGEESLCHPSQPVVAVNWFEAMAYCAWLTQRSSQLFRLPTEAEWEWAIRAGLECKLYAWGDENPDTFQFYRSGWREGCPHVVALREPNVYGIYDLGDNVHEWCLDWYDPGYYEKSPSRNPVNLISTTRKASRGGSWRHQVKVSRCAARSSLSPHFAYTDYGFRVVRATCEISDLAIAVGA